MSERCDSIGIPARLHQENRPLINDISGAQNYLYRSFPRPIPDGENNEAALMSLFGLEDDSCVLNSLCESPEDSFYNSDATDSHGHRFGQGVFQMQVDSITGIASPFPDRSNPHQEIIVSISPEHDPLECNYAHCELRLYNGEIRIHPGELSKGKQARRIMRKKLIPFVEILFQPKPKDD